MSAIGYGIQYVAHLVHVKNEINRKRRRFYNLFNNRSKLSRKMKKLYPKAYARHMYEQAKLEMKAMTLEMRRARLEVGARFRWSNHGAISCIDHDGKRYREDDISKLSQLYLADSIILGD